MVRAAVIATRPVPGGKALLSPTLSRHDTSAAAQGCAHARHGQPICPRTSHTCKHTQADRASRMARNTVTVVLQGQTLALADVPLVAGSVSSSPASHATTSVTTDINAMRPGCVKRSSNTPVHQESQNPPKQCSMESSTRPQRLLQHRHSAVQQMLALPPQCSSQYSSERKKFISPFRIPRCGVLSLLMG